MKGFFVVALICVTSFSHAQIQIGILGGGHLATVNETNNLPGFDTFKKGYSARNGAHFGFIANMPMRPGSILYFQPGVIFYNKGRKYADSVKINNVLTNVTATQYINYVDLPINLVLKLRLSQKTKFILGGGPYLSLFFNGKETKSTYSGTVFSSEKNEDLPVGNGPGKYQIWNLGANALAGFEIGKVFITANYGLGLNDFYQAKDYTGTFRHQVIGATMGIFFGTTPKPEQKIKDKDKDKDGIPDDKDACPDVPGAAITNGCPDKDGDGISDNNDKCPDVAGLAKYNGCPIPDSDNDGINDENDKCPNQTGVARYNGCPPPDRDADGVLDENDKCPDIKGTIANNGCPAINKEIVKQVNYAARHIQFKSAKADILPKSIKVLDEIVVILQQNPAIKLSIKGHTSTDGTLQNNMKLSQDRADNVKAYLESKGIDASRLTAKGFGPTQPINPGKSKEANAENRRVELNLSY